MRSPPSSSRRRRRSRSRCTAPWSSCAGRAPRITPPRPSRRSSSSLPAPSRATAPGGPRASSSRSRPMPRQRVRELAGYAPGEDNPALEPLALACFYVVDARRNDAFGLRRLAAAPPLARVAPRRGGAPRSVAPGGDGADPRLERAERRGAGVRRAPARLGLRPVLRRPEDPRPRGAPGTCRSRAAPRRRRRSGGAACRRRRARRRPRVRAAASRRAP